jgi:predicted TIM-barrel fold metal-dependent hydrolase
MPDRIDAWTHIFPKAYFEKLQTMASVTGPLKRWLKLTSLYDLDHRFRLMDGFEGYRQLLTPSMPAIEDLADGALAVELMRLMNDGLAELVARHPHRFPAFAAALSLHDVGTPLDDPRFEPVFAEIARRGLVIWLHPIRGPAPDYPTEAKSRYEIWWAFGWPYDSSVAMARLVFSGLFDRQPNLKIITHHMGAMIPYFEGRIVQGWDLEMGARTPPADAALLPGRLQRKAQDYFKMFFADTALSGAVGATRCGLEYFGADKVVFASDFPFDAEGGSYLVRETIRALDALELSDAVRRRIDAGNISALIAAAKAR